MARLLGGGSEIDIGRLREMGHNLVRANTRGACSVTLLLGMSSRYIENGGVDS